MGLCYTFYQRISRFYAIIVMDPVRLWDGSVGGMSHYHEQLITISTKSLLKIVFFGLLLWFLWFIRDILFLFFVALLFAALIEPFANWLSKHRIPRGLAVLFVVLGLFGIIAALMTMLMPIILSEGLSLSENFGALWDRFLSGAVVLKDFASQMGILDQITASAHSFEPDIATAATGIFSTVTGLFQSIFSIVLVIVLTYYLVVQEDVAKQFFKAVAPDHYRPYISQLISRIRFKLGYWLRGQLVLSLLVGVLVYIGLLILGVEYALLLALFAAIMEVVPYLGPVIAAVPPMFVAFSGSEQSMISALMVLLLFVIIQQVENHLLVPKVMEKAVGINPIVSIISILVGVKFAGILGGLLAIPVATVFSVFVESLSIGDEKKKRRRRKTV